VSRFAGAEAGSGVSELYEAIDGLLPDGAIIHLEPLLAFLPVKLIPVSEWLVKQNWNQSGNLIFQGEDI